MRYFLISVIFFLFFSVRVLAQQKDTICFNNDSVVVPIEGLYRSYYNEISDECSSWVEVNYLIKSQLNKEGDTESVKYYKGPVIVCYILSSPQTMDDRIRIVNNGLEQGRIEWAMFVTENDRKEVRYKQNGKSNCYIYLNKGQIQIGYVDATDDLLSNCNRILKSILVYITSDTDEVP